MKIAGESYESISRAGGGIRSSARALARGARRARCCAVARAGRRDARPRDDDVRRQVRLRAVGGRRGARDSPRRRCCGPRRAADPHDRAARARRPRRIRRRRLDGGGRGDAARTSLRAGDAARSTSTSRPSRSATSTCGGWGSWRPSTGWSCAPTSSSSTATTPSAVAVECGARSVDHLSCLPPTRSAGSPRPRRRRAAAGRGVRRRRAPRARSRARRRGAICRARHRPQPRHVADRLAAVDHRARRPAATAGRCSRRCWRAR